MMFNIKMLCFVRKIKSFIYAITFDAFPSKNIIIFHLNKYEINHWKYTNKYRNINIPIYFVCIYKYL